MVVILQDIKDAIDRLSPEERAEVRAYLEEGESEKDEVLKTGTMRIDMLTEAAKSIRKSFTDEEWEAMNEEYIEPVDSLPI